MPQLDVNFIIKTQCLAYTLTPDNNIKLFYIIIYLGYTGLYDVYSLSIQKFDVSFYLIK